VEDVHAQGEDGQRPPGVIAADRTALRRTAEAMRQDERQEILVRFEEPT